MNEAVLIVDDSLTVRMDLVELFEAAGFRPVPCSTLTEARVALASRDIALVILDVILPDGDGLTLLREIRTHPQLTAIPVLLLSSEAEVKDRILGLQTGANDYVGKPYDTVYLLARATEHVRERAARSLPSVPTILIVDDSPSSREELRRACEAAGYAVLTAASGEEGLHVAAASRPTALVVDGVMPGIDGGTVIRRIRLDPALRRMPCILLTGSDDGDAELRALDAGADAFVRKEEDLQVVLARLAAVLRRAAAPDEQAATSLLGAMRILAVDDSPTYLDELSTMLRGEGYDVIVARSGEAAIDMLAAQPVDCILLDLVMPGLDGRETCRRIKASPVARDIPLIMLTAIEDREAMIDGFGTGADDFITKSSDFVVLKARVRAQLRRKQFEDENRRIREKLLRHELDASEERAARAMAEAKAAMVDELERKNRELEAFSYSVSHDLAAPLRSIDGFSQVLQEDHADRLDDEARRHLERIRRAARRMGELIEDLLNLSRIARADLHRSTVDLSQIAAAIVEELRNREPARVVSTRIRPGLVAEADSRLLRVLLENLLGNAWKFTSKTPEPRIEFGASEDADGATFFVADNGAGFDLAYAEKLFAPFQRFHTEAEFPGTGVGLATVCRIVDRHGGRVWGTSKPGEGATFFFTIPPGRTQSGH